MARIARGIDEETLEREPSLFTVINSSSPLRLDTPMLEGVLQMARRNQVVVLTPFTLAGAMAPVTLAGALAQQHAEALAGLVIAQTARAGSPFVYGGFTSNVDMKSGAPAFGTPEYMKTAIIGGQLARRLGLPYRSSNANAANSLDAQAAYESVFSLWGAIMGGVNLMMHGAGWMEGGLQASFEKMMLDADLLDMVAEFLRPTKVDVEELALEAMQEVGPGGHFFGAAHTQSRYRDAFFAPMISDWRNYESWREAGSPTALRQGRAALQGAARGISSRRRSSPSGGRRWRPSSPAARRKAARRRIFEGEMRGLPRLTDRLFAAWHPDADGDQPMSVIPAYAGIQGVVGLTASAASRANARSPSLMPTLADNHDGSVVAHWIPAFAGMTDVAYRTGAPSGDGRRPPCGFAVDFLVPSRQRTSSRKALAPGGLAK